MVYLAMGEQKAVVLPLTLLVKTVACTLFTTDPAHKTWHPALDLQSIQACPPPPRCIPTCKLLTTPQLQRRERAVYTTHDIYPGLISPLWNPCRYVDEYWPEISLTHW
jgi:hypothetical protein